MIGLPFHFAADGICIFITTHDFSELPGVARVVRELLVGSGSYTRRTKATAWACRQSGACLRRYRHFVGRCRHPGPNAQGSVERIGARFGGKSAVNYLRHVVKHDEVERIAQALAACSKGNSRWKTRIRSVNAATFNQRKLITRSAWTVNALFSARI